ncbi:Uncharacterised protein [Rodentibacter pneumotropicus]|uniref:Uncharacterized protein n=1 Tax=Rodentibacter pneumotropicus TaxID=758 RepID=A0A3S4TWB1_9PAST|nr:Uncharacterised protein [Rodentibacter pneumotropicus]
MGETIIHTNQVDNRGGEIRTQDKLVLNATTGINNQKWAIRDHLLKVVMSSSSIRQILIIAKQNKHRKR